MRRQPGIVLLVSGEVVEDDMDLAIGRVLGDEFSHEGLEIDALLGLGGLAANEAGGDFERREQVDRAMPFVGAFEALNNLAAAGQHIPPGPLQRLDRRLLVDAQDQRMFRRVQVEPDDIGGFGGKLLVGADAPRPPAAQLHPLLAQQAPYRIVGDAQGRRTDAPSQLADPLGGGNSSWRRTRRRRSAPYFGVLPGRTRSRNPASPAAAKRLRHRPTVFGRTPSSRPTASLCLPSRHANTILARSTRRASSVRLRASVISSALCSAVQLSASATRAIGHLSWYAHPRHPT